MMTTLLRSEQETLLIEDAVETTKLLPDSSIDRSSYSRKNSGHSTENLHTKNGRIYRRCLSFADTVDQISLTWEQINVYAPLEGDGGCCGKGQTKAETCKRILNDVSGLVKPGTLLAIMGASGAGKTTLLNVLTYRNRGSLTINGEVKVNGQRIGKGMTSLSGYVQQDDLFVPTISAREHLWFQAMLRMDASIPNGLRVDRINDVMKELGLLKCADTLIGKAGEKKGLSGGEMKRLSFASEVLTNPALLFCDEPTSGLDSFMAENVIQTLKNMASKGKTIICTIHQPSSEVYALFDRVMLMAEGRVAYLGPAQNCLEFFAKQGYQCPNNYNPADYFVHNLAIVPGEEVHCRDTVGSICDTYDDSHFKSEVTSDIKSVKSSLEDSTISEAEAYEDRSRYKAGFFRQFHAVFWRSWVSYYRDRQVFVARLIQQLAMSLLGGVLFFQQEMTDMGVQNINGAMFWMQAQSAFSPLYNTIYTFPEELPLYFREHGNGMYRPIVYFLSKNLAELPVFIFYPVMFVSIFYWMVGLYPAASEFFVAAGVLILVANCGVSFGYLLSTCSSTINMAITLAPPFTIPLMMFGGFFVNTGSIPSWLVWLKYLSWFQYANEILVVNQWEKIDNITCTLPPRNDSSQPPGCYSSGADVIAQMRFSTNNINMDVGMLFVLFLGYRAIALMGLLIRTKLHK